MEGDTTDREDRHMDGIGTAISHLCQEGINIWI